MATEHSETEKAEKAKRKDEGTSTRAKFRWLLAPAVLAVLACGIFLWIEYNRDRVSTDDAHVDGHIIPVASMVFGTVSEVLVDDNQTVHTGDAIIRI
ncbi:MAG: biotin/lipoyl-binding protein, partial [Acidobacteriota bacterium]